MGSFDIACLELDSHYLYLMSIVDCVENRAVNYLLTSLNVHGDGSIGYKRVLEVLVMVVFEVDLYPWKLNYFDRVAYAIIQPSKYRIVSNFIAIFAIDIQLGEIKRAVTIISKHYTE